MNRFQNAGDGPEAPRLFLLSTRAGGLGINLTAADTVIFYDQDWVNRIPAERDRQQVLIFLLFLSESPDGHPGSGSSSSNRADKACSHLQTGQRSHNRNKDHAEGERETAARSSCHRERLV